MRRFINADSLASTGQGFAGTNMFAYCNNNPVCYVDEDGDFPTILWWLRIIHNAVADAVSKKVGGIREVKVTNGKESGRLDVYVPSNNTYYEIKPYSAILKESTINQMKKYDGSVSKYSSEPICRETTYISGKFKCGEWEIEYWYNSPGLIVYKFKIPEEDQGKSLSAAAAVALLAFFALGGRCETKIFSSRS